VHPARSFDDCYREVAFPDAEKVTVVTDNRAGDGIAFEGSGQFGEVPATINTVFISDVYGKRHAFFDDDPVLHDRFGALVPVKSVALLPDRDGPAVIRNSTCSGSGRLEAPGACYLGGKGSCRIGNPDRGAGCDCKDGCNGSPALYYDPHRVDYSFAQFRGCFCRH